MGQYKLLALDMDGTLLTSEKVIAPESRATLRKATDAGVITALSTGRSLVELADYRDDLAGTVRYASLLAGALLCDLRDDSILAKDTIDTETALAVAREGQREDAMVIALAPDAVVTTRRDVDRVDTLGLGVYQEMYYRLATFVEDPCDYIEKNDDRICKISLYCTDRESMLRVEERLKALPVQVSYSEAFTLEVSPVGVSKASGLLKMAEHFGLDIGECVMTGDGLNDLEVLKTAGLGVAMGNASDEVKACADVSVADNDHGGIAEVVERYFL